MTNYRKKPIVVEATRYGKDEDGSWYNDALKRVARFLWGYEDDRELSDEEILDVLQPTGAWNPPENAELEMWDAVAHKEWLPLSLGDWVIKGVNGEFYPCKPDIFAKTYLPADEEALEKELSIVTNAIAWAFYSETHDLIGDEGKIAEVPTIRISDSELAICKEAARRAVDQLDLYRSGETS